MRNVFAISLILVFTVSGCATHYSGRSPDLTLRGEAAQNEIETFSLKEAGIFTSPSTYVMGLEQNLYTPESIEPIIQQISPQASRRIQRSKTWQYIGLGLLTVALGTLIYELADGDDRFFTKDQSVFYYSLLGLSVGTTFVQSYQVSKAVQEYNQDLRSKFTPSVSLNYSF